MAEEQHKAAGPDLRFDWFIERTKAAFKTMKGDKVQKFITTDGTASAFKKFCDSDDRCVFVFEDAEGLVASSRPAPAGKMGRKMLAFCKNEEDSGLAVEDLSKKVAVVEVSSEAIRQLMAMSKEVYFPLLTNPGNQAGWPEVIAKELIENLHRFMAQTFVTMGHMNGETLLPLPPDDVYLNMESNQHDKDSVHVLETAVIAWTHQIKDILRLEPESMLTGDTNPGPTAEIDFWAGKSKNLNLVHDQLNGEKVRRVMKVLEVTKSTYFPAFNRLCKEVAQARMESNDNMLYLKSLEQWISQLGTDFSEVADVFRPLLHTILLIWRNSKFYNTPGRLVVLMREICNQLIRQAVEFVNGPEIFEIDPELAVESLKTTLKICVTFKSTYFDYKARASTECPSNPWRFQNSALFSRLDGFLERCHDILDLMQTIVQFIKLERVEIGGTKGKSLTANVQDIYVEFMNATNIFKSAEYNIMDLESKKFDDDYYGFRCCTNELERRLASIIVQAFDDSTTVLGCFKLFDSFEGLLERDIILSELDKKNTDLLNAYANDLRAVQELFMEGYIDPPIANNTPPHSGAVSWSRGLIERVEEPMTKLKGVGKSVLESEEGKEVVRAYAAIQASLREFEVQHIDQWCVEQSSTGAEKLKMNVLRREEGGEHPFLRVNFDPALICLLREVKYFSSEKLNIEIPENAREIFKKNETYRQQTGNLDIIVNTYNKILETVLDVERPLLQAKLDEVDKHLFKGLKSLNWKSPAINEFIQNCMTRVVEIDMTLHTIKDNVASTQKVLKTFTEQLMIDRNPTKTYPLDQWQEQIKKSIAMRCAVIQKGGGLLHDHLSSSQEVLKVKNSDKNWRKYVDYVNEIVVSGLCDVALASMRYLSNQVDEAWLIQSECQPLLEIALRLAPPKAVYAPLMGRTAHMDGLRDITDSWLSAFVNVATLVNRLDSNERAGDYLFDLQADIAVKHSMSKVNKKIDQAQAKCEAFRDKFMSYSYLWTDDIDKSFSQWKEDNKQTGEEVLDSDPPLSLFDAQILKYKALDQEIRNLPNTQVFGPFKIDAKPIKSALASWVSKWTYQYQQFLLDKVTNSVASLDQFVRATDVNLDTEVGDNDRNAMLAVMGYLRDVRKRTAETDAMFEPLRHTVTLLGKHSQPVSDDTLKLLEETPLTWNNLKKKAVVTKEKQAKSQSREADNLKREGKEFEDKVAGFYKSFRKEMPFEYMTDFNKAYKMVDAVHHGPNDLVMTMEDESTRPLGTLKDIAAEAKNINELQELFELYVIEYREIRACEKDACNVKAVWDVISSVQYIYSEWKKTKWDDINVEVLQEENKKLQKEVKGCDKVVKNWPCYKGLEDSVKNMQSSLPLVEELRSKAMRDRHWRQVMKACGIEFKMDDSFTFGAMLALELHKFEDDVLEIVDRATKELGIEKQLQKLDATWKVQNLTFPQDNENPDLCTLFVEETVMEALEDNSMLLQNLFASKYVQGNEDFLAKVQTWQKKLGTVENVLKTWKDVQGKWGNLQSIFIGSADIRVQLPEDSKRFDGIDGQWKELMKEAVNETNAVLACNLEGRSDNLEGMLAGLEKCEKALKDYLETKRLAYPRFYFVADADLLDILSKGSNPQLILKHMPKCFDNIKTLEFNKDDNGVPTKVAIGMYSQEQEYVAWPNTFTCEGAVETWLYGLTNHTHDSLIIRCNECVSAFDDKPREQFIFDWCAQLVSVICRIVYTEDVNRSFERLEEGDENAMRDYNRKQIDVLNKYAELILTDLQSNDRKKIIMLMTLDVHARDITQQLIDQKLETKDVFAWMSQLKFRTDDKTNVVAIDICDYTCYYGYEYIGNCGCLVVTPLTDRCYITLTQAMRLILGGAPAGPAGTGKTETTKDLGRALGVMVYVFNCSDQMDYKAMGGIFKGLSQAGAWGCFDEFNRIDISVLSVVSTQYKTILDAIRGKKARFDFEEENIPLCSTPYCCSFITMNPGYAGRTELPESVKALFRPCAMITPDMDLICEIMLMSEGYAEGKVLARKFMMLYRLSEALLSAQKHYDWKLRAVKTTLNVAGGMRRQDMNNTESRVLLRALRDFNLGKLVADDVAIFIGMIDDLFPKQRVEVQRQRELDFEAKISEACVTLQLQPEELFLLKTSQLREIAVVRWSVFVLGSAGCGKSEMIKTLAKAQNLFGEKATISSLNPKSVTRNELYGYVHPATREWKDGLLSQIFRDLANTHTCKSQYLILDGDIDAEWIESMNTVMDDNKTLTLASNERIPLIASMRLLLEVENMREASPATVSRGGVIFMNAEDVGWMPYVVSWIARRDYEPEKALLLKFFQTYPTQLFAWMRKNCSTIVFLPEIARIQHLCYIIEGIIGPEDFAANVKQMGQEQASYLLESYFVYALMWAIGGATFVDKQVDHRKKFCAYIRDEFKTIRFPDGEDIFEYCVDETKFPLVMKEEILSSPFQSWTERVEKYSHSHSSVFGNIYVATMETQRLSYLLDILIKGKHAVMFVGGAGTGKTTIMNDKLRKVDADIFVSMNINMNCFTDSMLLQTAMETVLEKKTGRTFGPTGSKKMIYFIDDINMPQVDKYGTQQPIALMRQLFDYAGWYSRDKLTWRDIQNVQVVSCLNPTAGSFYIDVRLQRSYCTYAVQMPSPNSLDTIFKSILTGHFEQFAPDMQKQVANFVNATVEIQMLVANTFFPTAIKFHYVFNLRDVGNIFEGLLRSMPANYPNPLMMARLWMHECERVFADRMITREDLDKFDEMLANVTKKHFQEIGADKISARPLMYTSFTTPGASDDDHPYCGIQDEEKLSQIMEDKLREYNETNPVMNLVLFQMAIEHICRITRVIDKPRGNALLVGVGGSGKQSLSKLSSFICGYEYSQITVTANYSMNDFREYMITLYTRAACKGIGTCFILTDGQIVNERMMVWLNDMLATGNIPDVFTKEVKDEFSNAVRNDCKQAGIIDTPENLWNFFVEKSRKYLHLCLCFSPVGDKFRIRARQFPALISCTCYDYFHPWPNEALISVAKRFINNVEGIKAEDVDSVANSMAFIHTMVNTKSLEYLQSERRYNYTTPKSYLDLISLYKSMLADKKMKIRILKDRLENGLEKMNSAAEQVAELQENLVKDMAIVAQKKEATDALIVVVGKETNIAMEQKAIAQVEEEKCSAIAAEVMAFQAVCEKEMAAAEPVIQAAMDALNSLEKKSLTELKSLASPPAKVDLVTAGVIVLLANGKVPKDLSWGAAKKMMGNVDQFLTSLLNFDKDNTPVIACEYIEKNMFVDSDFTVEVMNKKSSAAAGMCAWVINIVKYYRIYEVVEPKRVLLAEANVKLEAANTQLAAVRAHVAGLEAKLAELNTQFENATQEKNDAIASAEKTQRKADMATRLVNGLADENVRWTESVKSFDQQEAQFVGDVLVASAFVSYIGAFNSKFRNDLVDEQWIPDMIERKVPMTEGVQPLNVLTDEAEIAGWCTQGLPADSVSVQNGAIVANCKRWPLLIDPQLQGIKWLRRKHTVTIDEKPPDDWDEQNDGTFHPNPAKSVTKEMRVVQLSQNKYLNAVELAISNGEPIMIENIREDIDAVLDPVLMRSTIKRGKSLVIKLGDKEVDYDPKFTLYIQTKLGNPHYKPEIAAQTTLLNFMITVAGLEEQLLGLVVNKERPDLEEQKAALMDQQNGFKLKLKALEDELLYRLSSSQGDILEDIELIEGLERAKVTATEIQAKQEIAKETEKSIAEARKAYIPVAVRGALVYFLVDQLWVLEHLYRYSMANYVTIFKKGMDVADKVDDEEGAGGEGGGEGGEGAPAAPGGAAAVLKARVMKLIDTSCYTCFQYVAQGLFERHKLVFASQLTFQVQRRDGSLVPAMFDFLIQGKRAAGIENPLNDWLANDAWLTCHALKEFDCFEKLPEDLVASAKRFREWYELERPEEVPYPGEWKKLPEFEKLLLMRALRLDRMNEAMSAYVKNIIGQKYVTSQPFNLKRSYMDVTPQTPVFFILSAGVDPVKDTEKLGHEHGIGFDHGNLGLVSLGQGQEPVAERAIETSFKNGGWAFLQNIHLTPKWTGGYLEKRCDDLEGAHEAFRMFLSAEPAMLPINVLQVCVKLTNEPPQGLQPNVSKNWKLFTDDFFDSSARPGELKSITFAICLFHAIVVERKKFGPQGWNRGYPFNFGDLTACAQVGMNYLENNPKVPWEDLRYIFGDIMYGGHVTDYYDRVLVNNYLNAYLVDELVEGFEIFPGCKTPQNAGNAKDILEHIDTAFPQESPTAFGLHPNAEIGFRLMQADTMFSNIRELQPRSGGGGGGLSVSEKAAIQVEEITAMLPDQFDMLDILDRAPEIRTPYVNVFLQEIERMQELTGEIKRSLGELTLGLRGDLQITDSMENLMNSLANNMRPGGWEKFAYPSKRNLASWVRDMIERQKQLADWTGDMNVPKSTCISFLFNPQSFLTAVMQTTARANDWPLDRTVTQTDVQKKYELSELPGPSKEGAFIHGLSMEGARWDDKVGTVEESRPKELYAKMPIVLIKAAQFTGEKPKDTYMCPTYKTQDRGPTFVFEAGLKTKAPASKWILGGVGLLMDVDV